MYRLSLLLSWGVSDLSSCCGVVVVCLLLSNRHAFLLVRRPCTTEMQKPFSSSSTSGFRLRVRVGAAVRVRGRVRCRIMCRFRDRVRVIGSRQSVF